MCLQELFYNLWLLYVMCLITDTRKAFVWLFFAKTLHPHFYFSKNIYVFKYSLSRNAMMSLSISLFMDIFLYFYLRHKKKCLKMMIPFDNFFPYSTREQYWQPVSIFYLNDSSIKLVNYHETLYEVTRKFLNPLIPITCTPSLTICRDLVTISKDTSISWNCSW